MPGELTCFIQRECLIHEELCGNASNESNDWDYYEYIAGQTTPYELASVSLYLAFLQTVLTPFVETPIGAAAWIATYFAGRLVGGIGFHSTVYQYDRHLYGTNGSDVWVAAVTTVVPVFAPPTAPLLATVSVLYSKYRLDYPAPVDIPWLLPPKFD
jgi:hypothetical protein